MRRTTSPRYLVSVLILALSCAFGASGEAPAGPPAFVEVGESAGIGFVHHKPVFDARLEKIMNWMASLNAGVAAADYDGDGDTDLYLLNSLKGVPNHLYRNDGGWTFTERAAESGLAGANDEEGVSMDALFADYDNDGDQDLFIAGYGRNRLYLNDGGVFREVGEAAGIDDRGNAAAVVTLDYDDDGWLDLMVGHYFDRHDLWNLSTTKILQTGFENARNGGADLFYRNDGDGTFTETAERLGLDDPGWTLALGTGDFDDDGAVDVYVANDYGPDLVWRNRGDGTFEDITLEATGGDQSAGMNVDVGDYDGDGDLDVYVTNILNVILPQGNMLWRNEGGFVFTNVAEASGTKDGGWGWAAKFFDFDHDGDLDIFTVNGFVSDGPVDIFRRPGTLNRGDVSDIRAWPDMRGLSLSGYEHNRFFRNDGGAFAEVADELGLGAVEDGRGIALADLDLDGDLDVLVTNAGKRAFLYRNDATGGASWLQVALEGRTGNRDAIGARATVVAGGRRLVREVDGGNGFSSQSSRVLHFGLARAERIDRLEVRWPGGKRQVFKDLEPGRRLVIHE